MRRSLVIQLARFGDLVQSKRLILSLAREGEVHLCVDISLASLAAVLYPFAGIHPVPAHAGSATGMERPAQVLALAHKTFQELRTLPLTSVYTLNNTPLSLAFASLFPAEIVHGYTRHKGQPERNLWCRLASRWIGKRASSPLNLVDFWAHLHPSPIAPESVNPIPRKAQSNRIGIVMAGRQARRSLPAAVLGACVQAIFGARGGPTLVTFGGKSERPLVRQLARYLSATAVDKLEDHTGSTALTDLPELLQGLDLLITPDTGIMHLAAHLGVPVQAFFLSSAWCFETGPYGMGHTVWQAALPCSPCLEATPCPHGVGCLTPFSDEHFLTHLAGKPAAKWPENLLGCISQLDSMGVVYLPVDGEDVAQESRTALRNTLADYVGKATGSIPDYTPQALFQDADWILPQRDTPSAPFNHPTL